MYAVIETGGKQYRVQPGDIFQVEKLEGDVGTSVKFDQVLLVSKTVGENAQIWLGKPLLSGAAVQAEIVGQGRGEKIRIVKMKRRKQYRRNQGHRQYYTQLLVMALDNGAGDNATLSDADKKASLSKFQSHLKAKGPAQSPKRVGSKKKRLAQKKSASAPVEQATPKKTAAKKAPTKKKAD